MMRGLSFGINEFAGSVGDVGTILPLVFAVAASGALSITPMRLFLGIWFIIISITVAFFIGLALAWFLIMIKKKSATKKGE